MEAAPTTTPTCATSRLAARLEHLSHAALVELCALACTLDAHDSRTAADATLARHDPLPAWAVDTVLLSSDIAPRLTGAMAAQDCAAAAVCRAWREAWRATRKQRRELHAAPPLATPDFVHGALTSQYQDRYQLWPTGMVALPGDRLCIATRCGHPSDWETPLAGLHVLDAQMRRLQVIGDDEDGVIFGSIQGLAASESGLYVAAVDPICLCRFHQASFELLTEYNDPDVDQRSSFFHPVLAPGGLLFAGSTIDGVNEIMALDALTLERRYAIGRALFSDAVHYPGDEQLTTLVVVGQELYVGDAMRRCLHIFSFAGEHLRDVRGDWGAPESFCFVEDRIYLIEGVRTPGDFEIGAGRRIIVLTPEGLTLQVYTAEAEWASLYDRLMQVCHFDGRLVVLQMEASHLFALQGI